MIYGYIRVSTDKQTVENQRYEIKRFCEGFGTKVDRWISETASGAKDFNKRELGELLKGVKEGDTIICSEISRLGRNLYMVMEILNYCLERRVKIWTIKDNYRLGDDITSKVLAFAFALSAEIERKMISQRTKEALKRLKADGVKLGRPKGPGKRKLDGYEEQIKALLAMGISRRQLALMYEVHHSTLYEFLHVKGLYTEKEKKQKREAV